MEVITFIKYAYYFCTTQIISSLIGSALPTNTLVRNNYQIDNPFPTNHLLLGIIWIVGMFVLIKYIDRFIKLGVNK